MTARRRTARLGVLGTVGSLGATALLALLPGCSSRFWYDSSQAWQRQECQRIHDTQERNRCNASTARSYEDYRRETEAARRGG